MTSEQDAGHGLPSFEAELKGPVETLTSVLAPEAKEMTGASKELRAEESTEGAAKSAAGEDDGIFSILYSVFKKVSVVGAIYLVGYMGWSVAWLITPIILAVTREQWRKVSDAQRNIAKISATTNEKDVILARITDLPAWVYFPDVERAEWLNRIIHQVWPNANYFTQDLVKNVIEPKVAKALSEYKMSGFRFDRIILGTIPPRIGGVKVYDKNIARNEIILDVDLFYASDCDISFQLAGMKGGIKDFQIHGMLRIILKPLIRKMPLIGGLQIFFLNKPNIDFNLVGVVDLLDMPGLSDMLRRIIVEQISAVMVLPNKLPIILSPEVPATVLKTPEPEGVLRIHVVEGKDLMKKDISMLGKGKSDPYAIISVGAQQFRTKTIDNTVNPKWDYWCEAEIASKSGQTLHIQICDEDNAGEDETLGRATVEISNVVKNGTLDTWLTLEFAKHGLVHLRLTWLTLSSNGTELQAALEETQQLRVTTMSTALLIVYIDSASDLPQARPQSKPDPFVQLTVGKQTEQTAALKRTDVPVWEQGFTFLVANPENDVIHLKVVDQKTEKDLGQFTYILGQLLTKESLEVGAQPFQLQKSGPESKITMSLALKILKSSAPAQGEAIVSSTTVKSSSSFDRGDSFQEPAKLAEFKPIETTDLDAEIQEHVISASTHQPLASSPSISSNDGDFANRLIHRTPSTTSSAGAAGLGRIQMTLRYSIQRQRLVVIVHKIMNIPLKDPTNIPDPYVKLYLLPGRSKESKRKTAVVKDNVNPSYDATFEYIISAAELHGTELEVTVATQKGFLSGGSPVIGMVKLPLEDPEISQQGATHWHDLQPEIKSD